MTANEVVTGGYRSCVWFDDARIRRAEIHASMLVIVQETLESGAQALLDIRTAISISDYTEIYPGHESFKPAMDLLEKIRAIVFPENLAP